MWETRSLLTTERFSFTAFGAPLQNHWWLSQLVFYGIYTAGGPFLLTLFAGICALAACYGSWRLIHGALVIRIVLLSFLVVATAPEWSCTSASDQPGFPGALRAAYRARTHSMAAHPLFDLGQHAWDGDLWRVDGVGVHVRSVDLDAPPFASRLGNRRCLRARAHAFAYRLGVLASRACDRLDVASARVARISVTHRFRQPPVLVRCGGNGGFGVPTATIVGRLSAGRPSSSDWCRRTRARGDHCVAQYRILRCGCGSGAVEAPAGCVHILKTAARPSGGHAGVCDAWRRDARRDSGGGSSLARRWRATRVAADARACASRGRVMS